MECTDGPAGPDSGGAAGQPRFPASRFAELLRLSLDTADLGEIPQTLDAVQVGAADHIRFSSPKTVLVLGANEGVFPRTPAGGGLISDRERRRLIACGLPITNTADRETAEGALFCLYGPVRPFPEAGGQLSDGGCRPDSG